MNWQKRTTSLFLVFTWVLTLFCFFLPVNAQNGSLELKTGWIAKKAVEVPSDGTQISRPDYTCSDWLEAVIPGTILTTLLHNGKVPDPFYGMNNELIPDVYFVGRDFYSYWFVIDFQVPESFINELTWITFRGINYYADVFINGKRVNKQTMEGMFLRHTYQIDPYLKKDELNRMAVLVKPPDPVGNPNGGQGGDGTIGRSITNQFVAGWDWISPIRDRNTGIWDKVYLYNTGPLSLQHPFIKTRVPGKRYPDSKQDPAQIKASVELVNSANKNQKANVVLTIDGKTYSRNVLLPPRGEVKVEFPEIIIKNPRLWWPNGYGNQELYNAEFTVNMNGGSISDSELVTFGIREFSSRFDREIGARIFMVNGQKIFIKGGNWIGSDALHRLSKERYMMEVKMHAEMNLNMIRIWGGSITERPEFYEACDKFGILVMQDLWITGDCNGRWLDPRKLESQSRRREYPDDHPLFLKSLADQIKMLRNHASLCVWCGGNEFPPPDDIQEIIENELMPELDGTRYYLPESTSDSLLTNTIGGNGDGPYNIREPEWFFTFKSYPFNPEIGSVGFPNYESLKMIMDEEDLVISSDRRFSAAWRYHKYIGYGDFIERYGEVTDLENYSYKAQIINYNQYRALIEGWNSHMWDWYTGVLIWKTQNPWTALRGMMYDHFLDQNGGYYGVRKASEPVHIQFNLDDSTVCLVNHTTIKTGKINCSAILYDLNGQKIFSQEQIADLMPSSKERLFKIKLPVEENEIYFLKLDARETKGSVISDNIYWLTSSGKDYSRLETLKPAILLTEIKSSRSEHEINLTLKITNDGKEVAFFTQLKLFDSKTGKRILPAFYSDNFITIIPGESREVIITIPLTVSRSEVTPDIWMGGWNTPLLKISIKND